MANSTIQCKEKNYNRAMDYTTSYPNGKQGQSGFSLSVPLYNPTLENMSVIEAYIYDSNGNWTDIKSSVSVKAVRKNCTLVEITFNSSYVGKLLRVTLA